MTWLYILIAIVVIIALFILGVHNKLISLKLRVENAWAQIDTQLKRRFDLVPNLVETIKGYTKYEQETFEKVVEARNKYIAANGSVEATADAEQNLASSLKNLFALAEAYPDLKANTQYQQLQIELSGTEDKVAYARQFYNDCVTSYNSALMMFPNNVVAGMFGGKFQEKKCFEIENPAERENVKVQF